MLVSLIAVLAVAAMASTSYTPNQKPLGHPTPEYPIPGGEPWRNCVDPTDHLFKIDSAGMDPNPCMVYVHICFIQIALQKGSRTLFGQPVSLWANRECSESLCKINITGNLTKYITNATISFNVAPHFNDGRVGEIPGIDDFYQWVNVYQNNTRTRHLQPGPALMNQSFLLWGGWVPVVSCGTYLEVLVLEANNSRRTTVLYSTSLPPRALCSAYAVSGR